MIDRDHLGEAAAAFALGALTPEERDVAARHLAQCAQCRADVEDFRRTIDVLPLAAPPVTPDATLKQRIVAAAKEDLPALRTLEKRELRSRERRPSVARYSDLRWRTTLTWAAVGAAAVLVGAIGLFESHEAVKIARMQRQMIETQSRIAASSRQGSAEHAVMVAVANGMYWKLPSMEGGKWQCTVLQPPHQKTAMLLGTFPPAPNGMVWRVWIIHHRGVHAGGMIHPGTTMMHMPMPVQSGDQIAFTMEHPSASAQPGAPFMMRVTLD